MSLKFKEPIKGFHLEIKEVALSNLEIPSQQRRLRPTNLKRLESSIEFTGFWSVPIVISAGDYYEVIDGQHRVEALKSFLKEKLGKTEDAVKIPVLIVPEHFKNIPLHFNLEEKDDLKDKGQKIYLLYMDLLEECPDKDESEALNVATVFNPYLIPIGFSYQEYDLNSGSLIEPFAKKFMGSIFKPLKEAVEIRRQQAESLKDLESLILETSDAYSIKDYLLKKAILTKSITSIWGRKRYIEEDWENALNMIKAKIIETDWSFLSKFV